MDTTTTTRIGGHFFEKLEERVKTTGSLLCVGLDPHAADLRGEQSGAAAFAFCKRIVDETKHVAVAYKPNSAFFERLGGDGLRALRDTVNYIPRHIPVLLDVKRGDISSTAKAYADAAYDFVGADAVTISPYMGADSIKPFTEKSGRAVFILCKTSNKTSDDLQSLKLEGGRACLFEHVASLAEKSWGCDGNSAVGDEDNSNNKRRKTVSSLGLVVGATDVDALRRVRAVAPNLWILAPGVGAQGGDLEGILDAGLRQSDASGVLVTVSRGISRATSPREAAEALSKQIADVRVRATKKTSGDPEGANELAPYQRRFIEMALRLQVLRFGSFTLKSGRVSPFFFNAGLFRTGAAMNTLSKSYAAAIQSANIDFDVLFGPAYKGIPLVAGVAMTLSDATGRPISFAYNRKERKDHGEGGVLVGAELKGKKVLIVDDVITAGTAVREAIKMISAAGATAVAVALALDRQEVVSSDSKLSAVEVLAKERGLQVVSVVTLRNLIQFAKNDPASAAHLDAIRKYRETYGSDSSK
eukprot:g4426.t1